MQKRNAILIRTIFSLVGLASLMQIIQNYGVERIIEEIKIGSWGISLLILSFVPTLVCYSLSWLLITDQKAWHGEQRFFSKWRLFTKFSLLSIAWNNLTPFLKVGGEPLKYMLLSDHLPKRDAMASTINYNLIHLFSTALSFSIGALAIVFFYDTSSAIQIGTGIFLAIFAIVLILIPIFHKVIRQMWLKQCLSDKGRWQRVVFYGIIISLARVFRLAKERPLVFWSSVAVDTVARFVEGLTFYISFQFLSNSVGLFTAGLLDVGRTLVDTLFFFIPYQMGTREEGVHFFMEKVFHIDSKGFLTAVLFYRLVEIVWIVVGYLIWISSKNAAKEVRHASA